METITNTYRKTSSSHKIWFDWNKEMKIVMPLWPAQTVDLEKLARKPSYLLSSVSVRSHWIEDRGLFWELEKYPRFKFLLLTHFSSFLIIEGLHAQSPSAYLGYMYTPRSLHRTESQAAANTEFLSRVMAECGKQQQASAVELLCISKANLLWECVLQRAGQWGTDLLN